MIAVSTLISLAVAALLARIPRCHTIVTTGEKASALAALAFHCPIPPVGGWVDIAALRFWRMPSTSRAYPLPLEKKDEAYRQVFPSARA